MTTTARTQGSGRLAAAVRALASFACAWAIACGGSHAGSPSDSVRVRVHAVLVDQASASPVVVLEEASGERQLPIWIGVDEARSIALQLEERALPRPNGHDLARLLIRGLDAELERVIVTDLRDGVFYALLQVETQEKILEIDARPSDAIAIALRAGAPIFVHEALLERDGLRGVSTPELRL